MKITEVSKHVVFYVQTDKEDYNFYIRHSENNWSVRMGESDEPLYDCAELEKLFKEWNANNSI